MPFWWPFYRSTSISHFLLGFLIRAILENTSEDQ